MAINTEVVIIKNLIINKEYFSKVFRCLSDDVFQNLACRQAFKYINKNIVESNIIPTIDDIELLYENDSELNNSKKSKMDKLVEELRDCDNEYSIENLSNITLTYIKHTLASKALLFGAGLNEKGEDLGGFLKQMEDIIKIKFDKKLGTSIYDTDRIKRYDTNRIKTKHEIFDTMTGGGAQIGTMAVIYAGAHTGKSQFKIDVSLSAFRAGLNVLYITGEMTEDQTLHRVDSNNLQTPTYKINPDNLSEDTFKQAIGLIKDTLIEEHGREIHYEVHGAEPNNFTSLDLLNLCEDYKMREGKVFDMIFIDSLNLMAPNDKSLKSSSNSAQYFSATVKEFRSVASPKKLAVPIVTSWHIDTSSMKYIMSGGDITLNDAGEYKGVAKDADYIMSLKSMYVRDGSIYHDNGHSILIDENIDDYNHDKHNFIMKAVTLKTRYNTVIGDRCYFASYPSTASYDLLWSYINRGDSSKSDDLKGTFKSKSQKREERNKKTTRSTINKSIDINESKEQSDQIDNFYRRDRKKRR